MPWQTPTLKEVRGLVRDDIRGALPGADASVPNSVLRVVSDAQAGLAHLNLQYIDWLALQLLPDTAEHEWLDRHAEIWLLNSDGSKGRKQATFAIGIVTFTGTLGIVVPVGTVIETGAGVPVGFETTLPITIGNSPTEVPVRALDAGAVGNIPAGLTLTLVNAIDGVEDAATAGPITGGVDTENDDDLRYRVLQRIQEPPQGGAAHDYVNWTLAVPGVTRAWCYPTEMGMGTVTVRFMMDELRAEYDGIPLAQDIAAVQMYLDKVRPVAVKDMFVVAPIRRVIDVNIERLIQNTESVRAGITNSVKEMLFLRGAPGQTIFAAWKYQAVMASAGVESFHLSNSNDDVMPSPGHMAVLGDISFF